MFLKKSLTKVATSIIVFQLIFGSMSVIASGTRLSNENENYKEKEHIMPQDEILETLTSIDKGGGNESEYQNPEKQEVKKIVENNEKIESSKDYSSRESEELASTKSDEEINIEEEKREKKIVQTGISGTSKWELFDDGLFVVGSGTLGPDGSGWPTDNNTLLSVKRIEFESTVIANPNSSYLFSRFSEVIEFTGMENFDTSNVTNMDWMFSELRKVVKLDLSNFDTHNVTNMSAMFMDMWELEELDVSGFDTRNVTDMNWMFRAISVTELDVSKFDTRNVTMMSSMFNGMSSLIELDVSSFDTSNVTNMVAMFSDMSSLVELDLSSFDTRNVAAMNTMFSGTSNLSMLLLGSEFRFVRTNANLPAITQSGFSGRWVGLNTGTAFGSSSLLMTDFAGEADTYVWEGLKFLKVKVPVTTLFSRNQEDPTQIESSTYTLTNQSTHPVHVTVASVKDERNIEDIALLQMNGISLIENGETTLSEEPLIGTLPPDAQQPFSYTGQARQVTNEVNPSFNLVLRFSF